MEPTQTQAGSPAATTQAPAVTQVAPVAPAAQVQPDDLVSRVSKFVESNAPEKQVTDEDKFDYGALNAVKSPEEAKAWADKAYKSFQRGFNDKYQTISDLSKQLQGRLSDDGRWTKEKVQSLIQNPEFVQVAQSLTANTSGLSEEEFSTLTETEKQAVVDLKAKVDRLEQQNSQTVRMSQDTSLKTRYANYESSKVDQITQDLMQGKLQATREHLWKVLDYDSAVQRAYEMGKQDKQLDTKEKLSATSYDGVQMAQGDKLEPEKGETSLNFFKRIAQKRIAESRR